MCSKNTIVGKESQEAIQEIGIPMSTSKIGQRTAFRKAAAYGVTVFDLGNEAKQAAQEITNLTDEIREKISI